MTEATHTTESSDTSESAWVRLSVNLAPDVADTLKSLAKENQITVTEAVRRAIGIYQFVDAQVKDGHKLLISAGESQPLREVVLL